MWLHMVGSGTFVQKYLLLKEQPAFPAYEEAANTFQDKRKRNA